MHRHRRVRAIVISATASVLAAAFIGCVPGLPGTGGLVGGVFNLRPVPIITVDVLSGIAPLTVSFRSDRSTDDGLIVEREWNFGDDSTSLQVNPSHTYTATGTFTATLSLTDEQGAQASSTVVITVTEAPLAVINADRTAAANAPATISFDATSSVDPDGEIVAYAWDFGDGARETGPVVEHTFSRSGTFRVRLTVTDDVGITDSAETLVEIGIRRPTLEIRIPTEDVSNLVLSPDSPLWISGVFDVEPSVPTRIRAGIDGDQDICNSKAVRIGVDALETTVEFEAPLKPVTDVDFSPDGFRVLTASRDGVVQIYNAFNGFLMTTFRSDSPITAAEFSPDASQVAFGREDGLVEIRAMEGGAQSQVLAGHTGEVTDVAFSPSGNEVLSGGRDGRAILWDADSGAMIGQFVHDAAVSALAFSPLDGNMFATADATGVIRTWDIATAAVVGTFTGHTAGVNDIVYSFDGAMLLSGGDDDTAILWSIAQGVGVMQFGHDDDVLAVAFPNDNRTVVTGGSDGVVRVFDRNTGQELRSTQPCDSPISALSVSPTGNDVLAGVSAFSDIQLDTDPPSGNDLDISVPRALRLQRVASLGNQDVSPGTYFLWAEIVTDRTSATRAYADVTVNVVEPFTEDVNPQTPVVPLIDDRATVLVSERTPRKVFDLGPVSAGDRLFLSLTRGPSLRSFFESDTDFSLMLLDENEDIFAWFQPEFILFTPASRLVISRDSENLFVVVDGRNSVNVRIERNFATPEPRGQRVFVNFEGVTNLSLGGFPPQTLPPLEASDFNGFFAASPNWGAAETTQLKQLIMQQLRDTYSAYDVEFFGSNENGKPRVPFQTVHVGGRDVTGLSIFFGFADYIDPRNETQTGTAAVYATDIAEGTIENSGLFDAVDSLNELGAAIGVVAAHEVGHLLGLRHTSGPSDLMQSEGPGAGDPTQPRAFLRAEVAAGEQFDNLPAIGFQNAPILLEDTIGAAP